MNKFSGMDYVKKVFHQLFIFLILLLPGLMAQAQTKTIEQLINQSSAAIEKGNYQEASQFLQQVLNKDANNIGALSDGSYVYGKLKNYPAAIQCSKQLTILQPDNANYWNNTGWYLLLNNEFEEAKKYCLQALELNDCSYNIYLNLGHVYSFLKQQNKSLTYYYKTASYIPNREAYESIVSDFDLFEKTGNFPYKIAPYKNMFVTYYNNEFLKKTHGTNILDSIYQLTSFHNYSVFDDAIIAMKERFLVEERENEHMRLYVLRDFYWSLGWQHLRRASKSVAISEYFLNVTKISNDLKDTSFVIDVLYKVGNEFDLDAGVSLIKQGLDLAILSKNYNKQYSINLILGDKYKEKNHPDSALPYFRNCFILADLSEISDAKNVAVNRLMLAFAGTKQYDSVTYYYTLIKKESFGKPANLENSFTDDVNYCSFLIKSGKPAAAIQLGKEVIRSYVNENSVNISDMYEQLGNAYVRLSKTDSAIYYYRAAIKLYIQYIQSNPGITHDFPLKQRFASFLYLKRKALSRNDITDLFDLSEQTKANILFPKLTGNSFPPKSISIHTLAKELKHDEVALSFGNSCMTNVAFGIAISKDSSMLVKEDYVLLDSLTKKHGEVQWQELKNRLDDVLDSAKTFEERSEWNTSLTLLSIIGNNLNNMMQVGNTRGIIIIRENKSKNYAAEMLAYNDIIYQLYIKPFEKILAGKKTIYVSPDMGTTLIPFEALKNEQGEYLGNLYNIIYVPSFTSRAILKSTLKPGTKRMLAAGNPVYNQFEPHNTRGRAYDLSQSGIKSFSDLPGTGKELLAIQQDVPGATIIDKKNLTETGIKALSGSGELAGYDILHFAVHGMVSINDHRDNTLIVSEPGGTDNDGFLQYDEIAQLHLDAGLVCLSACETAAGIPSETEEVKNLPVAFFLAGAHAVIATWWKIDDEATGIFMASFYRFIFKENKSYSEALYLTRQKFITGVFGEKYKSPYYWAAFKYFGN